MLDNCIARKNSFGYEASLQKVTISCISNYHTKLLYKPVCKRLLNFQPLISDACRAAFEFHQCNSNHARKEVLDARYQKPKSHFMFLPIVDIA